MSFTVEQRTSPNYVDIDVWIVRGSDSERDQLLKHLVPFKDALCCANASEWWWRYAVAQYFQAIALYEREGGKSKQVTINNMNAAFASIQRATHLNATKQAALVKWYTLTIVPSNSTLQLYLTILPYNCT